MSSETKTHAPRPPYFLRYFNKLAVAVKRNPSGTVTVCYALCNPKDSFNKKLVRRILDGRFACATHEVSHRVEIQDGTLILDSKGHINWETILQAIIDSAGSRGNSRVGLAAHEVVETWKEFNA